jgi:hypothetical protein
MTTWNNRSHANARNKFELLVKGQYGKVCFMFRNIGMVAPNREKTDVSRGADNKYIRDALNDCDTITFEPATPNVKRSLSTEFRRCFRDLHNTWN